METALGGLSPALQSLQSGGFDVFRAQIDLQQATFSSGGDTIEFSSLNISIEQSSGIVTERALDQLRAVVEEARAALGLEPEADVDTSPEATANRILDFALSHFEAFAANHPEFDGDAARQEFADFIGQAIQQGIDDARGILEALSALSPEVDNNISAIEALIQQRLEAFANGDS